MNRRQVTPTLEQLESLSQEQLHKLMLDTTGIHFGPMQSKERLLAQFALKLKFNHPIYSHSKPQTVCA